MLLDNDDPEKYPRSRYELALNKTMLLFPSEDPATTLAFRGEVGIEMLMECVSSIKDEMMHSFEQALAQPQGGDAGGGLSDPQVTYRLAFKLNSMYPFMCNTTELDGRRMEYISKRKIMEPVTLSFETREFLQLDRGSKAYKASGDTSFKGEQVFLSISYQDIMHLSKAFVYNMKMLEREYFTRLIYFNKLKSKGMEISDIAEEGKEESGVLMMKRTPSKGPEDEKAREKTNEEMKFFGAMERAHSEYIPMAQTDDDIWQVVSDAMQSMEQLQKASKAMYQYKQKASVYAMKHTKTSVSRIKSTDSLHSKSSGKKVASALLDEKLLKTVNDDLVAPEFLERGSMNSGTYKEPTSVTVYERISDTKAFGFESFKIVPSHGHAITNGSC